MIKALSRSLRQYKKGSVITIVLSLLEVAFEILIPLCMANVIDEGIDVGNIDQVLQIGCPRSISSTMQRLGRAGHNPGQTSYMFMYPRTSQETLFCGMSAAVAKAGGIEQASPPKKCLDVLAQHLVSMAAIASSSHTKLERKWHLTGIAYTIDDVMELLQSTYTFQDVSKQEVTGILCMLAGDFEHKKRGSGSPAHTL